MNPRHRPTHGELIEAVRRQANESTKVAEVTPRLNDPGAQAMLKLASDLRAAAEAADEPTLADVGAVMEALR